MRAVCTSAWDFASTRKSRCASCRVSDRCRADADRGGCFQPSPGGSPASDCGCWRRPACNSRSSSGPRARRYRRRFPARSAIPLTTTPPRPRSPNRDSFSSIPTTAIARISSRYSLPRSSGSRRWPDSTVARWRAIRTASRSCSGSSPPASCGGSRKRVSALTFLDDERRHSAQPIPAGLRALRAAGRRADGLLPAAAVRLGRRERPGPSTPRHAGDDAGAPCVHHSLVARVVAAAAAIYAGWLLWPQIRHPRRWLPWMAAVVLSPAACSSDPKSIFRSKIGLVQSLPVNHAAVPSRSPGALRCSSSQRSKTKGIGAGSRTGRRSWRSPTRTRPLRFYLKHPMRGGVPDARATRMPASTMTRSSPIGDSIAPAR